jgi:hypothetical protein
MVHVSVQVVSSYVTPWLSNTCLISVISFVITLYIIYANLCRNQILNLLHPSVCCVPVWFSTYIYIQIRACSLHNKNSPMHNPLTDKPNTEVTNTWKTNSSWDTNSGSATHEFPIFYGTVRFITVFTRAFTLSLSCATWAQCTLLILFTEDPFWYDRPIYV